MSKLVPIRRSRNDERENNDSSCEACGRMFESPIRLTNLSAMPMQTYDACPFCFSRLNEDEILEEPKSTKISTLKGATVVFEKTQTNINPERTECPHYFGYLKKRPKNSPIPDTCLTCEKMINCLL